MSLSGYQVKPSLTQLSQKGGDVGRSPGNWQSGDIMSGAFPGNWSHFVTAVAARGAERS